MTLCGQKCKTEDEDSRNYLMEAKWKLSTRSFLAEAAASEERIQVLKGTIQTIRKSYGL